jgi:hypothetical protein
MSVKNRIVGGVRRRGFGRCGTKPKKEFLDFEGTKKALDKALARLEGVSVEKMRRINKAKVGKTVYGEKTKRHTREDV